MNPDMKPAQGKNGISTSKMGISTWLGWEKEEGIYF
jgi:hypothetical protein